ncbi:hypothetical protein C8R44DRAFT_739024 [Mycena epipterygia]|nr:hypothetical protein C8R44DRAFT_739024 [Mycena epipterygia]
MTRVNAFAFFFCTAQLSLVALAQFVLPWILPLAVDNITLMSAITSNSPRQLSTPSLNPADVEAITRTAEEQLNSRREQIVYGRVAHILTPKSVVIRRPLGVVYGAVR